MAQKKIFYLTREGLKRIKEEYEKLKQFRRAKTMAPMPPVLHSEEINPEYLSSQEDMGFLEGKIAEIEMVLDNYKLIKKPPKHKRNQVNLGAIVSLEIRRSQGDGNIERQEFKILGSMEANPQQHKISNESPLGKALLNHKVEDIVEVRASPPVFYKIIDIRY